MYNPNRAVGKATSVAMEMSVQMFNFVLWLSGICA